MAKIFISHASADKVIIDWFYQLLLDGLDLDGSDIFFTSRPGGPLMDGELYNMIKDQIRECTSIIFLFSKNFLKSEDCKMEYHYADGCNKFKHVLLLDGMSHNDLQRTPFYSSLCRQLNNKENLLNVLKMLKREFSLTSLDEGRFEPAVSLYLRLGCCGGYYFFRGKVYASAYTNAAADDYVAGLESKCNEFDEENIFWGVPYLMVYWLRQMKKRLSSLLRNV